MKGLLLKDIMNLRTQGIIYALLIALWAFMSIKDGSPEFFVGAMIMFSLLVPMSAIAYDEKAKWDGYALTMPLNDTDMVLSKYLLGTLCALFGLAASFAMSALIGKLDRETIIGCVAVASLGVVVMSIMLPLLFKFGAEKARLIVILIVLLPMVAIPGLLRIAPAPDASSAQGIISAASLAAPFAAIALLAASAVISVRIYKRKEF